MGCATGTVCASSYVNLFKVQFEENIIFNI